MHILRFGFQAMFIKHCCANAADRVHLWVGAVGSKDHWVTLPETRHQLGADCTPCTFP